MLWKKLSTQKNKDLIGQTIPAVKESGKKKQPPHIKYREDKAMNLLNIDNNQLPVNKSDRNELEVILQSIQPSGRKQLQSQQSSIIERSKRQQVPQSSKESHEKHKTQLAEKREFERANDTSQNKIKHDQKELQSQLNHRLTKQDYVDENSFAERKKSEELDLKEKSVKYEKESKNYSVFKKETKHDQNLSSTIAPVLSSLSKRQAEFKAFSQGNKKKQRKQSELIGYSELQSQTEGEQWQIYDQNVKQVRSIKKIAFSGETPSFQQKPVQQGESGIDSQMPVDDFVKQMQDAGIDVADLQSNYNDISRADRSKDISLSLNKGNQEQQEKQDGKDDMMIILDDRAYSNQDQSKSQKLKQEFQLLRLHKIQIKKRKTSQDDPLHYIQKGLKIQKNKNPKIDNKSTLHDQFPKEDQSSPRFYDTEPYFNEDYQRKLNQQAMRSKLISIHYNIKKINVLRKQIIKFYEKFQQEKQKMSNFANSWINEFINFINQRNKAQEEQLNQNGNQNLQNHSEVIELLKFKVLQLEAKVLEKQIQNEKQKQVTEQIYLQKEQLNQIIFDLNQQLAQSQLTMQQKIDQYIIRHQNSQKLKQKQNSNYNSERSQIQVQRLNQQVEQLKKLYQHSHEQYNKSLHNQRLTLSIQLQKIARKQVLLHQRQQKMQEGLQKLKAEEERLEKESQKLQVKQQQIAQMEKTMKEKLLKVQELEEQLNEGFAYLDEVKKEQNLNEEKIQQERKELRRQIDLLEMKIRSVQLERSKQQNENLILKQKSLPSQRIFSRNSSSSANANRIRQNLRRNKQLLTQYEEDEKDFEFDIRMNSRKEATHYFNDDLQYTFMNTDRCMNKGSKGYLSSQMEKSRLKSRKNVENKYRPTNPNEILNGGDDYRDGDNIWKTKKIVNREQHQQGTLKKYQNNNYVNVNHNGVKMSQMTGHSKHFRDEAGSNDNRFMSQVVSSTPYFKNTRLVSTQTEYPKFQYKQPSPTNFNSPKLSKIFYKSLSSNKIGPPDAKLNQLDTKIQMLRNQIKREINAAKRT